jgi:hypothetical protein
LTDLSGSAKKITREIGRQGRAELEIGEALEGDISDR